MLAQLTCSRQSAQERLTRVRFLEHMLAADGVHFLKLWFHLPRKEQLSNLKVVRKQPRRANADREEGGVGQKGSGGEKAVGQ